MEKLFPDVLAIDVMVAPRVIEELDKHKTSTNQRKRDRARAALQLIDQASVEPDLALLLREEPIRIRLVISTALRLDWAQHPKLDPAKPDDQLVAEALSLGNQAGIFSHDTGPRIRARIAGISSHAPATEWLLPIEKTDDQRKITKLEQELRLALSRSPNIIAGLRNLDETTSRISIIRPIVPPLDARTVNRLATDYLSKNPPRKFSNDRTTLSVLGITEYQLEKYASSYSSFESGVHNYYSTLHERVRRAGEVIAVEYFVSNDSGITAEGLRIEFQIDGNASLLAEREDAIGFKNFFSTPNPSNEPHSTFSMMSRNINIPTIHNAIKPRDPVGFYWIRRPEIPSRHSALQCQEFRATREFSDSIFAFSLDNFSSEISIDLSVSAANLPAPVNLSAKLTSVEETVDWSHEVVRAIIPDDISKLMGH